MTHHKKQGLGISVRGITSLHAYLVCTLVDTLIADIPFAFNSLGAGDSTHLRPSIAQVYISLLGIINVRYVAT